MRKAIGVLLNDIHTFRDLGLALKGIEIEQPEPKLEPLSIPMSSRKVEMARLLSVDVPYEWRDIKLYFDNIEGYQKWAVTSSRLRNLFHGQEVQLILDTDKGFYYTGTAVVDSAKENNTACDYTITINADPYKYERYGSLEKWKWNDFNFLTGIIRDYKELHINGSMDFMIPGRRKKVVPVFECSSTLWLTYLGESYELPAGRSKILDLQLGEGEHWLTFTGNTVISIDYRGASL